MVSKSGLICNRFRNVIFHVTGNGAHTFPRWYRRASIKPPGPPSVTEKWQGSPGRGSTPAPGGAFRDNGRRRLVISTRVRGRGYLLGRGRLFDKSHKHRSITTRGCRRGEPRTRTGAFPRPSSGSRLQTRALGIRAGACKLLLTRHGQS